MRHGVMISGRTLGWLIGRLPAAQRGGLGVLHGRRPAGDGEVGRGTLAGILDAVITAERRRMAQRPADKNPDTIRKPGEGDEQYAGRMRDLKDADDAAKRAREAEGKFDKEKTPENGEKMAEAQEEEALRRHQYTERHQWPDDIARREALDFWWARVKRHKSLKEAFRQIRREREARGLTLLNPPAPPAQLLMPPTFYPGTGRSRPPPPPPFVPDPPEEPRPPFPPLDRRPMHPPPVQPLRLWQPLRPPPPPPIPTLSPTYAPVPTPTPTPAATNYGRLPFFSPFGLPASAVATVGVAAGGGFMPSGMFT